MSKPDWTEAPDDATHWDTVRDFFCSYAGYWYKGVLFDVNYHIDWNTDRYIERPTGWDSEGYPPIGWHGQARLGGNLTWLECIVLSGHALAVGGEGDWTIEFIFEDKAPEFKPLPTKEDQEREAFALSIQSAIEHITQIRFHDENALAMAARLIGAGYRKADDS